MGPEVIVVAAAVAVGAFVLLRRNSNSSGAGSDTPIFSGFGFHTLRLRTTESINHDTKRLVFELPNPRVKSGLGLTSAVLAVSRPSGLFPVLRPYTPVNDLDEPGILELLIKKYSNGKQSTHLHSLRSGDTCTFAPIKGYAWTPNAHAHIALVAGGQGITPCYQLVRHILKDPADRTRITLVWGVNSEHDILLRDELAALVRAHPERLAITYVVRTPPPGSAYTVGFVTRAVLEAAGVVPARYPGASGSEMSAEKSAGGVDKVFVCGPPAMEKALTGTKGWFGTGEKGILGELGYEKGQIYKF